MNKKGTDWLINAKPMETMDALASDANAAAIATKVNDMIGRLIAAGLMYAKRAVTYVLTNIEQTSQPTEVTGDSDVTITLTAANGYALPTKDGIEVICNHEKLTEGSGKDYVYTQAAGTIAIEKEAMLGDLTIKAVGYRSVTQTLSHATSDNPATVIPDGAEFKAVYTAGEGYTLPSTITGITIGGSAAAETDYEWDSESGELTVFSVTGALVVTVTAASAS